MMRYLLIEMELKMKLKHTLIGIFVLALSSALQAVEVGLHLIVDNNLIAIERVNTRNKTDAEAELRIREKLDIFITDTNLYYSNSLADIQLKLEKLDFRDVTNNGTIIDSGTLLSNIKNENGVFKGIFTEEDRIGADYLGVIVNQLTSGNDALCGQATSVNTNIDQLKYYKNGFMVTRLTCGSDTFAHEIGHLMGLAHGKQVGDCKKSDAHAFGIRTESRGFAVSNCDSVLDAGEFGTIMVGNYLPGKIPLFSNPRLSSSLCGISQVCGREETPQFLIPIGADSVLALNSYNWIYAARESRDADMYTYPDASLSSCIASQYANKEISEVKNLSCATKNIGSIEGLDVLQSLTQVDLSGNNIVNVSPLKTLDPGKLVFISLTGNNSALCHELEDLEAKFPGKIVRPQSCFNIGTFVAVNSLLM